MLTSQLNKAIIGLTAGDPAGVGPEIILKALSKISAKETSFLIIGDYSVFTRIQKKLKAKNIKTPSFNVITNINDLSHERINLLDLNIIGERKYKMGQSHKICGKASFAYIKKGIDLASGGLINALVTAPVNKQALSLSGLRWPGHTEILAHFTKTDEVAMMFVAENLRVVLSTIHIPVKKISSQLKCEEIFKKIKLTDEFIKRYLNVDKPLIGVCGLNPHASDGGLFGDEEERIILPAVKKAKKRKMQVIGPASAESLFYKMNRGEIDALVCMYHDQGLVPLKMILRDKAVNLTLGLPFIRTSPSTGTAYDISDKLIASPLSMIEAIKLAVLLEKKARDK
jgi:4-phospho-D-threonate 3-dehydrogenase / 4-phospho-D-erythronate 3-dehydrogenase